jgi:hypothetical protein
MFAAMASPLKGDGVKESGGVETTPPSSKVARIAYSAVLRLTAADRPRSVAIS